jgi:UDP-N-acetyl-D-mannosaminuronate dehydrogenase
MNESLPTVIFERIFRHISENKLINPKITICGLAFKGQPPTDDLRGSPSLDLIEILRNKYPSIELFGQDFVVSTPEIESLGLRPVANLDAAFSGTHILVIANNHPQYAHTLSEAMLRSMSQPALVYDCCEHIPDRLRVNATHGVILTGLGQST